MNTFWTIIIILAIIVGVVILVQALRAKDFDGDTKTLAYKDGLPILPRDEREQVDGADIVTLSNDAKTAHGLDKETKADALSSLAMVASQTPNIQESSVLNKLNDEGQDFDGIDLSDDAIDKAFQGNSQSTSTKKERFTEPSSEFAQNSPVIDRHLEEQQTFDQNNDPLLNAQDTVTVVITPKDQYNGLSGKVVLDIVRAYGLKYGVMNMYHRYEHEDGTGSLWFSMLGVTHEGVEPFDLNTLTESHFSGLSLFLSLPHPHALRGFDSMVSVAQMIAKEINADVHDEEGYLLDGAYLAKLRAKVANYH